MKQRKQMKQNKIKIRKKTLNILLSQAQDENLANDETYDQIMDRIIDELFFEKLNNLGK